MDDEDTAELRNPFPSPPSLYTKYTSHNLKLLSLLKEKAKDVPEPNQHEILNDQPDVPDWPLMQLEKPRVDWILEEPDAYYDVFGDRWLVCWSFSQTYDAHSTKVKERILSLEESGGNQLYPSDPTIGNAYPTCTFSTDLSFSRSSPRSTIHPSFTPCYIFCVDGIHSCAASHRSHHPARMATSCRMDNSPHSESYGCSK